MKILFCGDRDWSDVATIEETISNLLDKFGTFTVIEGEARGADRLSRRVAEAYGLEVEAYPADWQQFGRAAGPIRNKRMLLEGKPDLVVAFHAAIADSKGTQNMLEIATKRGVPTMLIEGPA
jgi:hypothetical protein